MKRQPESLIPTDPLVNTFKSDVFPQAPSPLQVEINVSVCPSRWEGFHGAQLPMDTNRMLDRATGNLQQDKLALDSLRSPKTRHFLNWLERRFGDWQRVGCSTMRPVIDERSVIDGMVVLPRRWDAAEGCQGIVKLEVMTIRGKASKF